MSNYFYSDLSNNIHISYSKLKKDIGKLKVFNSCILEDNYYSIFKQLILSLLLDESIYLIDSEFSKLKKNEIFKNFNKSIDLSKINIPDLDNIDTHKWSITLFSSGTTGNPKKISHNFKSITRFVKYSSKHSKDVWGFAYNPTHIAGVQVFFQCFLNRNHIVKLFNNAIEDISNSIQKYKITHISATPTFYRLLCFNENFLPTVVKATSGGEHLSKATKSKISKIFPNASILNIYASTEAGTVIVSKSDYFQVKNNFRDFIKIEDDELKIHKSMLGEFEDKILKDGWYSTGDLVNVICKSPLKFKFISRKNDIVNVAGYMVNLKEVENFILNIKGVSDALVFSQKNSLIGNIVCADVVLYQSTFLSEQEIKIILKQNISKHKIPAKITFVSQLDKTRTGKKTHIEK